MVRDQCAGPLVGASFTMGEPLYELLAPYFDRDADARPSIADATTTNYLTRLTTLSHGSLLTTEPASLAQSAQSTIRSLQALSKRSHRSIISATDHLSNLGSLIPKLEQHSSTLRNDLPALEKAASDFSQKYDRNTENAVLDRRKSCLLYTSPSPRDRTRSRMPSSA